MLQTTLRERSTIVIVFLTVMGIGLSVAFYLYFVADKYLLLYYWDAVSHLVGARKLVDWSENPGWIQIGTVWLPLPHFLLVPFSLIDPLFTTGFAGLAVSLPSLAFTSVFLYKIVKVLKIQNIAIIPSFAAFAGALLYAANPNILYLGLTSMTEAPFMLFFVASAYYFLTWLQNGNKLRDLIASSIFVSLATLCRYEGWFLPIFLILVVVVSTIRSKNQNQQKILPILASMIAISSIAFWLGWNQYHYGDAFEFSNAQFYSAAWQAEDRDFRDVLFLQPTNVLTIYGVTAVTMYGPLLLGAGAVGYHIFRKSHIPSKKLVLIFLALPPLFTIISLVIGIGEMSYWFNSRFMVLLSPLIIVMTSIFLAKLNIRVKNRLIIAAVIGILFIYQLSTPAFSAVITYLDAKGGYTVKENLLAIETAEALKSLYDDGNIMIIAGSGLEHRIMITSGIPLRSFDEIIEGSTWKASFKEPWQYDKWFIITNHPLADATTVAQYWLDRQDELGKHYKTVYENEYYTIMVLR